MQHNEVWLLFRDGNHPLRKFLKKGFGHVYLLMKDEYNWFLLDPADSHLKVKILGCDPKQDLPRALIKKHGVKVLQVRYNPLTRRTQGVRLLSVVNCVTLAKYVLGVKLWAFTPYGLYRRLYAMKKTQLHKHGIQFVQPIL